jgi:capsular polysaccharide transport system permease protein
MSPDRTTPDRTTVDRGAAVQLRNIRALVLRDLMMRYGRDNIGFAWVILEPLLLTGGVMIVWSLTMGSDRNGVKIVEFILTGYMPLALWRHMTNGPIQIFRRSAALLYHRTITLFDILAARQVLEFAGTSAALLVVWGGLYTAGVVAGVARLDLLLLGWAMMAWLAFGAGAIIAALTERSETAERFIQPLQYVMLPISGAFVMVDWLPSWAQQAVLLNPMVHCYEVFRAGYFGEAVATHYDLAYFSIWALALTFVGLLGVQRARAWVRLQ